MSKVKRIINCSLLSGFLDIWSLRHNAGALSLYYSYYKVIVRGNWFLVTFHHHYVTIVLQVVLRFFTNSVWKYGTPGLLVVAPPFQLHLLYGTLSFICFFMVYIISLSLKPQSALTSEIYIKPRIGRICLFYFIILSSPWKGLCIWVMGNWNIHTLQKYIVSHLKYYR